MLYFEKISESIIKYYYLYFYNNKDNNYKETELPQLKREVGNSNLSLLMV